MALRKRSGTKLYLIYLRAKLYSSTTYGGIYFELLPASHLLMYRYNFHQQQLILPTARLKPKAFFKSD